MVNLAVAAKPKVSKRQLDSSEPACKRQLTFDDDAAAVSSAAPALPPQQLAAVPRMFCVSVENYDLPDMTATFTIPEIPDWFPESFDAVWQLAGGKRALDVEPYVNLDTVWKHVARLLYGLKLVSRTQRDEAKPLFAMQHKERAEAITRIEHAGKVLCCPSLDMIDLDALEHQHDDTVAYRVRIIRLGDPVQARQPQNLVDESFFEE